MGTRTPKKSTRGPVTDLAAYRRKRNFSVTREPRGGEAAASRLYVVQKHAASRLHYDFRLELDGTLKSWAVPKGPSVDPANKRLAVHVEDHPVEYGAFEGVIPEGEYGGGTVMLWDRGVWEPIGDAKRDYRKGRLKFRLEGKKLRGIWNLVRMTGPTSENGKNWLLIKDRDEASGGAEPAAKNARSVATGRSMEGIRREKGKVWRSNRSEQPELAEARPGSAPRDFSPQLATLSSEVPQGKEWLHEIKLDGYRILAFASRGGVRLKSRNGLDWSARFPEVVRAVSALGLSDAVLDGEVVALRPDGKSDFQLLQNHLRSKTPGGVVYFAFDLPFHEGRDLRKVPLIERKEALARIVSGTGAVRYGKHFSGDGRRVLDEACKLGLEGIVSKRKDAPYESKRAKSWLKIKCTGRQEFLVAGWTDPKGSRTGFGSMLLAHHDGDGKLVYAGKVGAGFDRKGLGELSGRFAKLARRSHPFDADPPRAEVRGAHWVRPSIVAEVEFTEWTRDGRLRHPTFVGLREDKDPAAVVRENPKPEPRAANGGVRLTHPDRVLWPGIELTKAGLAAYYESVAGLMLPDTAGRFLAVVRCPEGLDGPRFFQKHAAGKGSAQLSIEDLDGLLALVQQSVLEIHPWGSKAARPDLPDRVIFDLDPGPGVPWSRVIEGARAIRDRLAAVDLKSFVRTSGGKGLHVVAPLTGRASWDQVKAFARGVADGLVEDEPARYVAAAAKSRRRGKIFIDWLRNARGATAIASYSTRALPGAPVAVPLTWDELGKVASGDAFRVPDMKRRISRAGDPWQELRTLRQSIPKARKTRRT